MIRTSRTFVVLLVTLATLLSTASVAAAYEPAGGALFNNPQGTFAARWKIVKAVDRAVRGAPRGSRIMMSTFLMDSKDSADALLAAHRRNVSVQIVMDGDDAFTGQARRLERAFNRDNRPRRTGVDEDGNLLKWGPDHSFVVFCKGSCRGGQANLHAKFFVFTKTGTASNVSMVSSSNLNAGGAVRGWNDLYTVKEKPRILRDFSAIHAEMAQDTATDGDGYREFVRGRFTSRFYPKRRGGDPVMEDLSRIRCRGTNGGAGRNGRTAINVSMFAWNSDRGMDIARRLVGLDRDGCDVSIIYGAPSMVIRDYLRNSARRGGVKLWDSRFDRDGDGLFDLRVHHKYMLINGRYGADRSAWRVHTGSQNWGKGTLRNGDENTLNIDSRAAYRQYKRNWTHIAKNGARRID